MLFLHRVSIRTLANRKGFYVGWGQKEEADAASFRSASFRAQPDTQSSGRGVVATVRYDRLPQAVLREKVIQIRCGADVAEWASSAISL